MIFFYHKRTQENIEEFNSEDDSINSEESEEDQENCIRKFQTLSSSDVTCMVPKNPETDIVVNTTRISKEVPRLDSTETPGVSKPFILAPGEGVTPTDVMRTKDWEVRSWPCLFPSGKYGLHYERADPLSDVQYVGQRLYNKNPIYSSNSSYLFAMQQFIERGYLEKHIDVSFQKGKLQSDGNSVQVLSNHDAFSIFQVLIFTVTNNTFFIRYITKKRIFFSFRK